MSGNAAGIDASADPTLSLAQLYDPEILADPYPLYRRIRETDPVHWDMFLHSWVITRYEDVTKVLHECSSACMPTPDKLEEMGLGDVSPIARILVKQMLFMDPPDHTRLRTLAAVAFTPMRVEAMRQHIQDITDRLIDAVIANGRMEVLADFAESLPAIVTAEMLGMPVEDYRTLKDWSIEFAEILSNLQLSPETVPKVLKTAEGMTAYFRDAIRGVGSTTRPGLVKWLVDAEVNGDRLTEEEVISSVIITMVGAQETTTNLIASGLLSLFRNRDQMQKMEEGTAPINAAVEELLRYETPSQRTARVAPADIEVGGKTIQKGQSIMAVMAAANRDPARFPDPDRLDLERKDNRHIAFGWGRHYCFGAPLARIEGQVAFATMFRRLKNLKPEPGPVEWREHMGLRGLKKLWVSFD